MICNFFMAVVGAFYAAFVADPVGLGLQTAGRLRVLTFRWDTLFVAASVIFAAGFLLAQVALRVDLFRLLEGRQLSRASRTDEPSLYEFFAERGDLSISHTPDRRRAS
jgi:hypothetical protein